MIWVAAFVIHLSLKHKNEITLKHYLLFSNGEPHIDNTQSYQVHTCLANWKAWLDARRKCRCCIDYRRQGHQFMWQNTE